MAAAYCYKKGQHGLFHTWKLRYLEYDASSKMLVYRTAQGGKIQGQFVVSGVNPDHKDTAGHSQVFEILHADGTEPLLCAGPRSIDHSLEHCATSTPLRATSLLF